MGVNWIKLKVQEAKLKIFEIWEVFSKCMVIQGSKLKIFPKKKKREQDLFTTTIYTVLIWDEGKLYHYIWQVKYIESIQNQEILKSINLESFTE